MNVSIAKREVKHKSKSLYYGACMVLICLQAKKIDVWSQKTNQAIFIFSGIFHGETYKAILKFERVCFVTGACCIGNILFRILYFNDQEDQKRQMPLKIYLG